MATVLSGSGVYVRRATFTGPSFSGFLDDVLVLVPELLYPAGNVEELVLSGVEGLAIGAYLDRYVLLRGAGLDYIPARAVYLGRVINRVYSLFHGAFLLNIVTFFNSLQDQAAPGQTSTLWCNSP